jgi:multiple sugar transport system ATP-binding protein
MRAEIKELHQRLKTTTVYVTHDQVEAMTMADKIVVMHDGVVEQVGAPLELYDSPANMFVAGFIGSPAMNFLKGRCERGRFVLEDGSALPLPAGFGHVPSGNVVYGVRPEHLVLSDDGLPLTVAVVEPTGSETQVIARHGSQSIVCIFRDRVLPRVGETIRVTPDVSRIHLFSERDGQRLS